MAAYALPGGGMIRLAGAVAEAEALASRHDLAIACINSAAEVVLAGSDAALAAARAEAGQAAEPLRVSHAFHSPMMQAAEAPFAEALRSFALRPLQRMVVSTITGRPVEPGADLPAALVRQLTAPVRFSDALSEMARHCDLLIECGPGTGLARLARTAGLDCLATDAGADSLAGLLSAFAELWRRGVALDPTMLTADRPLRPLDLALPELLANPCGHAAGQPALATRRPGAPPETPPSGPAGHDPEAGVLAVLCAVVAEETGLPLAAIAPSARFLDDMHLNSLSVGRIVTAAAARIGIAAPAAATDAATMTVAGLATHLEELARFATDLATEDLRVEGVAPWVAEYRQVWQPLPALPGPGPAAPWQVFGPLPEGQAITTDPAADRALVILAADEATPLSAEAALLLWSRIKAARAAGAETLAVLHPGSAVEGILRSLEQEGIFRSVRAVDMAEAPGAWDLALQLAGCAGIASLKLDAVGGAARLVLRRDLLARGTGLPRFGPQDRILVTGGAGGIGAECALEIARATGTGLILAGRSAGDAAPVRKVLDRMTTAGLSARYLAATSQAGSTPSAPRTSRRCWPRSSAGCRPCWPGSGRSGSGR